MNKDIIDEKVPISSGNYVLSLYTKTHYFEGDAHGKMEDMPGNFMKTFVFLEDIRTASSQLERIATVLLSKEHILLREDQKEITNQPNGYARLYHNDLVERIKEKPNIYIQYLKEAVKKRI